MFSWMQLSPANSGEETLGKFTSVSVKRQPCPLLGSESFGGSASDCPTDNMEGGTKEESSFLLCKITFSILITYLQQNLPNSNINEYIFETLNPCIQVRPFPLRYSGVCTNS